MNAPSEHGGLPVAARLATPPLVARAGTPVPVAPTGRGLRLMAARALAQLQYRSERIGHSGLAGFALLATALALFVGANLPQRAAVTALRAELARGGHAADDTAAAQARINALVATLPARASVPELMERILAQADAAGVELQRGQYEYVPLRDGVAAHYRISLPVHTTYPQLRRFIDGTLATLPAVAVEGLRIERKSIGEEAVDAELRLTAFVRSSE